MAPSESPVGTWFYSKLPISIVVRGPNRLRSWDSKNSRNWTSESRRFATSPQHQIMGSVMSHHSTTRLYEHHSLNTSKSYSSRATMEPPTQWPLGKLPSNNAPPRSSWTHSLLSLSLYLKGYWYMDLKPGSVHSFEQLSQVFTDHFVNNRRQQKWLDYL